MSAPKLCKDCRWSKRDWVGESYRQCLSPHLARLGRRTFAPLPTYCEIERDECFAVIGACGASARYFEPRPPSLWQRILKAVQR